MSSVYVNAKLNGKCNTNIVTDGKSWTMNEIKLK